MPGTVPWPAFVSAEPMRAATAAVAGGLRDGAARGAVDVGDQARRQAQGHLIELAVALRDIDLRGEVVLRPAVVGLTVTPSVA